jgi:hypothetical protein
MDLRRRIAMLEGALGGDVPLLLEQGLDLLDLCGRARDNQLAELRALRVELAARALLDQYRPGG